MDLNKTLGIIGTPHEESIAMILSTKTCQIKRNRRNPAKTSSNPRTPKTPKSSSLTHGFGKGITAQRTTKGSHKFPQTNPHTTTNYLICDELSATFSENITKSTASATYFCFFVTDVHLWILKPRTLRRFVKFVAILRRIPVFRHGCELMNIEDQNIATIC
jgi:hypothetical protein